MSKLGRQTDQSAQETKERIKKTALLLFAEKGFDAISLREISRTAGVSHGLIRYHFGTKEDIWNTVFEDRIDYFSQLKTRLINEDFKGLPINEMFFQTTIYIALTLLNSPLLIKLIHREANNNSQRIERIINSTELVDIALEDIFSQVQAKGFLTNFTLDEYNSVLKSMAVAPNINPILTLRLLSNSDNASIEHVFTQYIQTIIKVFSPLLGIDSEAFIKHKLPDLITAVMKQKQSYALSKSES